MPFTSLDMYDTYLPTCILPCVHAVTNCPVNNLPCYCTYNKDNFAQQANWSDCLANCGHEAENISSKISSLCGEYDYVMEPTVTTSVVLPFPTACSHFGLKSVAFTSVVWTTPTTSSHSDFESATWTSTVWPTSTTSIGSGNGGVSFGGQASLSAGGALAMVILKAFRSSAVKKPKSMRARRSGC